MILDIKLFLYSVVIKGLLLVKAPGNAVYGVLMF